VTRVVVDASAGGEIVAGTTRSRALTRLLPLDAELGLPEHFYVEALGVIRHQSVAPTILSPVRVDRAVHRLRRWHLRQATVAPMLQSAWSRRHNMSVVGNATDVLENLTALSVPQCHDHTHANTPRRS
jgi:predicted nucleic acid-binding protein